MSEHPAFDTAKFRQVLGHFTTGVTVVTATSPAARIPVCPPKQAPHVGADIIAPSACLSGVSSNRFDRRFLFLLLLLLLVLQRR